MDQAIEAAGSDQLQLADKLIQRALSAGPANARFLVEAARIARQQDHSRRAERLLRRAVELSPTYREARELLDELAPPIPPAPVPPPIIDGETVFTARTEQLDWSALETELTVRGVVRLPALLSHEECVELRSLYTRDDLFEHDVAIADDRGAVDYRFFTRPLPELVSDVRGELYARLAPIANRWNALLGDAQRWPASHAAYAQLYRAAGHGRTSPILLRYAPSGWNAFHRDVFGALFFPLQMAISLGPARLGDGGEFALLDVRPGKRRVRAVATDMGDAIVFCTRDRLTPIAGLYGRQPVLHGVQEVRAERYALGIPFHDYQGGANVY